MTEIQTKLDERWEQNDERVDSNICEKCGGTFEYDEIDYYDGDLLCSECEQERLK